MNSDDPLLTAYALDELDSEEKAAFEERLHGDFAALAEVEATRAIASAFRAQLQVQPAEPLDEVRRARVFDAARRRERVIVPNGIPFRSRTVIFSFAAACLVVGACIRLLWPVVNAPWKSEPPFRARHSEQVFHFTLDNTSADFPNEPLVPFISVPDESLAAAHSMASPQLIVFTRTSPIELPGGHRFLPAPRFTALASNPVAQADLAREKLSIARANFSEGNEQRRRAGVNLGDFRRRLVPGKLALSFPTPSNTSATDDQPSFSIDLGVSSYSHSFEWPRPSSD